MALTLFFFSTYEAHIKPARCDFAACIYTLLVNVKMLFFIFFETYSIYFATLHCKAVNQSPVKPTGLIWRERGGAQPDRAGFY